MRVPREDRPACQPRTLLSLEADLQRFQTARKGNIRKAKEYNNVISEHFLPIPIDQVKLKIASSPGLQRKGGGLVHTAGVLMRMRNDFRIFYVKYFVYASIING